MLGWKKSGAADVAAKLDAVSRSQAVIEFNLDGTIITANQNFLGALGYTLAEIEGKHHSMFVEAALRESPEYKQFWQKLGRGEYESAEYKRIAKGGKEIWIEASYNPVRDNAGKPVKVIKFATDITAKKMRSLADAGKIAAIDRAQAVIEFKLDGTIVTANENFLGTLGYALDEIVGQHHRMFCRRPSRERRLPGILGDAEPRRIPGRRIQADRQGRQGNLDSGLLQSDSRREGQAVQSGQVRHRCDRSEAQECRLQASSTRSASRRR